MWHYPDKYLLFQNAIDYVYPYGKEYVELNIPATAGLMLHEYGHYFGLIHETTCIENIMDPDGPFNGYARSLYEILTGERIEVDVPLDWRSNGSTASDEPKQPIINIYPNPSLGTSFYIDLKQLEKGEHDIKISDPLGRTVSEILIQGDGVYDFECEKIPNGIYYVTIWNVNNGLVGTKVLVKN